MRNKTKQVIENETQEQEQKRKTREMRKNENGNRKSQEMRSGNWSVKKRDKYPNIANERWGVKNKWRYGFTSAKFKKQRNAYIVYTRGS